MKSIKTRLVIFFSVLLILVPAVLGYAANDRATAAVMHEGERALEVATSEASMLIRSFMDQKIIFIEAIAARRIITDDTPWEEKVASLQKEAERNGYETFSDAIEKTREAIGQLNQTGEAMNLKKDEIIDVIQNLSALAEENAAGTEEASASVEEQTSSMEQISGASEELAKLAEEMQRSISKFKY